MFTLPRLLYIIKQPLYFFLHTNINTYIQQCVVQNEIFSQLKNTFNPHCFSINLQWRSNVFSFGVKPDPTISWNKLLPKTPFPSSSHSFQVSANYYTIHNHIRVHNYISHLFQNTHNPSSPNIFPNTENTISSDLQPHLQVSNLFYTSSRTIQSLCGKYCTFLTSGDSWISDVIKLNNIIHISHVSSPQ